MAATIRDVAEAAGVHVSTVSRALSGSPRVSSATRERILALAEQIGYRPNAAAQALTTGRTLTVALVVADIANPFFPPLIKAAETQARRYGHRVVVADFDERPGLEAAIVADLTGQVDGVVLCSPRLSDEAILAHGDRLPLVTVNRPVKGVRGVVMDVADGAAQAIDHLVELGHRRIAVLAGPRGSWTARQLRRASVTAALERGAVAEVLSGFPPTTDGGEVAAPVILAGEATAVLAHNDLMAVGLLGGLAAAGVEVPVGMSVIGVDDVILGRYTRPPLTSVATPTGAAGRAAVDLLLAEGAGDVGTVTLRTQLVVRSSTGPPDGGRAAPRGGDGLA